MNEKTRVPNSEQALKKAFLNCQSRGKFKAVPKESYSDYLERARRDLLSAERDFQAGDFHWARIKAYQSLFHLLNAILVKHLGFFSKDHGCVIVALMSNDIITSEIAGKINLLMDKVIAAVNVKSIYEDIDEFRLQRNFALYKPKAWEEVKKEDVAEELDKIKINFNILAGLL